MCPLPGTQYAPGSDGLSGGHVVPDGSQVAYFSGSDTMSQTLSATVVDSTTYTLSALAGQRKDAGAWRGRTGPKLWIYMLAEPSLTALTSVERSSDRSP